MRVHFVAIGGSAMHNLAIALCSKGYKVTGSDDEIFEPAKSRLQQRGILPEAIGWFPEKITADLDAIILGMHAKEDNPELVKARELGIKIYSYPEYLYEQSKNKTRIVIGGSHGKTTITAMILHVLKQAGIETDYMVGAQLEGFDVMVKLSDDAEYMVFEGDEYLTSAIDRRPKFHLYKPHVALISGISWDHVNVFPTFENYIDQFRIFAAQIPEGGTLVYCEEDNSVVKIAAELTSNVNKIPYSFPEFETLNGKTYINHDGESIELNIFGKHNMLNLEGAKYVCMQMGVQEKDFYRAISSFNGASKRLELVYKGDGTNIYKDFAHSPSKLQATVEAVKEQFPDRRLVACMELHTYSSLNTSFLNQYKGTMKLADEAIVYYNRHALELKKLPFFDESTVKKEFGQDNIKVFNDSKLMIDFLNTIDWNSTNLLMMSSGDFDGINIKELPKTLSF